MFKVLTRYKVALVLVLFLAFLGLTMLGDWLQITAMPRSPVEMVGQVIKQQADQKDGKNAPNGSTGAQTGATVTPATPGDKTTPAAQPGSQNTTPGTPPAAPSVPNVAGPNQPAAPPSGKQPGPTASTGAQNGGQAGGTTTGGSGNPPSGDKQDPPASQPTFTIREYFLSLAGKLLPIGTSIVLGLLILSVAWLAYGKVASALKKFMERTEANERGRTLALRAFQLVYWLIAVFVTASMIAPEMFSKFVLGGSILTVSLVVALQGLAGQFFSSVLLHLAPKGDVGDSIALIGVDVKGKIKKIGWVCTHLETEDGEIILPNSELWNRPVKIIRPKSKIIIVTH